MAYVRPFIKVDIIGDCFGEREIWNTGLKLGESLTPAYDADVLAAAAEEVANHWTEIFEASTAPGGWGFSNQYRTTEVKASLIGTDGRVEGNSVSYFFIDPPTGAASTINMPIPQASMVGTFRSAIQRGPGSHGRMYLPGWAYVMTNDGMNQAGNTDNLSERFNSFVNNVNAAEWLLDYDFKVILASPVGDGVQADVVSTGVDRKIDTQRRRANALSSDIYAYDVNWQ